VAWVAQFILAKPSPEEIRAASVWKQRSDDFDKRILTKEYLVSYEADEHEIIKRKKALPSYPRLKTAGKIRAYLIGIPVGLFFVFILLASQNQPDVDDEETADNSEVVEQTTSHQWFENPALRRSWWNLTLVCSAIGVPLWLIGSLAEKRYQKMLGTDVRYVESDDEIYVANPTDFESWRQAFIDRHGHDMSAEQEKELRAKVDKVIAADEQVRAASRKLYEKLDEVHS
jgi:hypothetical protein